MAYLNANIPPMEAYVRGEFLRNLEDSHGDVFPCMIFGVCSIPGRVPMFHFMMEDGAVWWRMPIHAFCWKEDAPPMELDELMLWDSFSYYISVTRFTTIQFDKVRYISRRKNEYQGTYLFTLDWAMESPEYPDTGFSEEPGQHKCGHFIKLDNGNYAIQPNNRVRFHDPSFATKPNVTLIERKLNTHIFTVEQDWKWVTSDDDRYEYDIVDTEDVGNSNE